jgi:hypothetical protein
MVMYEYYKGSLKELEMVKKYIHKFRKLYNFKDNMKLYVERICNQY